MIKSVKAKRYLISDHLAINLKSKYKPISKLFKYNRFLLLQHVQ